MESTERRFAHLLQPIRELTKNWEVDVASELNDYLEELDEMCITFDDVKTRLNFAEAALLIQGSTCIYSRKVELLHSLVYQTLEYINDKNKKNKQAAESVKNKEDGTAGNHNEDDAGFTSLDVTPSNNSENGYSFSTVNDIPLPPESLIPQETRAKQKLPLIGLKGEIVCSQKDFRLNTLNPENGVILLTSSVALMEYDQYPAVDLGVEQGEQTDDVPVDAANATEANVGVDAAEENFLPLDDNGVEMIHEAQEHIDRQQAPYEGRIIRERRQIEAHNPRELPPTENEWAVHDSYAALEGDKPFKSGKSYKVPEGLDDGGKRKRKRPSLQDFGTWFRGTFDPPAHKLKNGPTFTDLNFIYLLTLEDKLKTKKRIFRKAGLFISDEELRQTLLQPAETEEQRQVEEPLNGVNHPGFLDDNSDSEQEGFPEDVSADFGGGLDFILPTLSEDQRNELSYEQLVTLRVEQLVVNSRGYTQETELSRRVKEWEDEIRPKLALQEKRPAFDIHDYGDRIVNAFNTVGHRRSFASIVSGLDNFETCKYLLASLQLANDYTVEIDSLDGLEESLDSMGLTLLSFHRATERFKNLQASS